MKIRKLTLCILVVVIVGAAFAFEGSGEGKRGFLAPREGEFERGEMQRQRMHRRPGPGSMNLSQIVLRLEDKLELDEEQIEQIEAIEVDQEQLKEIHEVIRDTQQQLQQAVMDGVDESQIRALVEEIAEATFEGATLKAQASRKVREVLTEQQNEQLDDLMAKFEQKKREFMENRRHGRGRGGEQMGEGEGFRERPRRGFGKGRGAEEE